MSIEVRNIVKRFGDFTALRNVTFEVDSGELVALLGPSGSGKTTLLRVIAGLEPADEGFVAIAGGGITDRKFRERRVGFVFQHYALFRHMTVFENVAFGLRVRPRHERPKENEIRRRVLELLKLVRLDGMARRYPSQLSGGQRQRVALARALAIEPKMLLLDEPFGSLDANVRKELRHWLRRLHDRLHMTSLFVTHDQEEALEVADRIVVMNEGRLEQVGTPDEVYHKPANPFVYNFLGNVNLFHARLEGGKAFIGETPVPAAGEIRSDTKKAQIFVRPHSLDIDRIPSAASFKARILYINAAGSMVRVELENRQIGTIRVELPVERYRALGLRKDEEVFVTPKEVRVFEDYSI